MSSIRGHFPFTYAETQHRKLSITEIILQGRKNDFKAAMDKVDQHYLNELSMGVSDSIGNAYNVHFKETGLCEDDMTVRNQSSYTTNIVHLIAIMVIPLPIELVYEPDFFYIQDMFLSTYLGRLPKAGSF